MALNTGKAEAALRDLTHKFNVAFAQQEVFYPNICTIIPSKGADEKYGWLGAMPGVREWLGDRQFKELRGSDFTLANKLWEDSILIEKDSVADDRMGMYDMVMPALAQRAAQHPDKLVFQVMVAGESAACYDGQFFYDTDHSQGDSGTQSNDLTYDATTTSAITVGEMKNAIRQSVTALLGFKDDTGEPFAQPTVGRLSDLMIEVPIALRDVTYDALESQILSQSSNVVIDRPTVIASPFLTDGTKFYTHYLGSPLKPFVFQAREPLSTQSKGADDLETKDLKWMTRARYNVGYLAWWNSTLTTFI